ncbi:MAG TPA: hypothetical protein VJS44_10020 [Pyrinomonadaceae bacterium]|nr:hypothetical protein [Pyrinomonadaceae bacterium]
MIYYAQTNYLPDLDANSSVALLAVASITGGIFLLCVSAGLIMPGLFWALYIVRAKRFVSLWRGNSYRAKKRIFFTFLVLAIPLGILVSIDSLWGLNLLWFSLGLVSSCFLASVLAWLLVTRRRWGNRRKRLKWWEFLALGVLGNVGWLFCSLPFSFVLTLASRQGQHLNEWDMIITVVITLVFVVVINALIPTFETRGRSAIWIIAIALITSLIVLKGLNSSTSLSSAVMRQYGLGAIPSTTMVFTQQGCETLDILGLTTSCVQKDGACRIDQVQILSRLGFNYYLRVTQSGQSTDFTLPNSAIISWTKQLPLPCKSSKTTNSK